MRLLNGVVRQAAASAWRSPNFVIVFSALEQRRQAGCFGDDHARP